MSIRFTSRDRIWGRQRALSASQRALGWYSLHPSLACMVWRAYKPLVEGSLKSSEYVSKPEGMFVRMGPSPLALDEHQGRKMRRPHELFAGMSRRGKEV